MIDYYYGDIFESPVNVIFHVSNCFNTMGRGIAYEIKHRYPRAYEVDCLTKKGDRNKLGQFTCAFADAKQDKTIFNLYSMFYYGGKEKEPNYKILTLCLKNAVEFLRKNEMQKQIIGIPYNLFCGNNCGDWEIVEQILNTIFRNSEFTVLICKK